MTPEAFLRRLARIPAPPHSLNLYAGRSHAANIRRQNLATYLAAMHRRAPHTLLLGEAPGHRGARLTGVPFSCESLLQTHPFFAHEPYQFIRPDAPRQSETSATIVWNALATRPEIPLIWNIFPFHPHQPAAPHTNRPPNTAELALGKAILLDLLQTFPIQRIAAVGRKAESMLTNSPLPVTYIRHPARGGKQKFIEGLEKFG